MSTQNEVWRQQKRQHIMLHHDVVRKLHVLLVNGTHQQQGHFQ
jgi:hypothetical protein